VLMVVVTIGDIKSIGCRRHEKQCSKHKKRCQKPMLDEISLRLVDLECQAHVEGTKQSRTSKLKCLRSSPLLNT
jgi:hypothetical protein